LREPLRIAYLTSAFARPSDTFIRGEVNQLRALGAQVHTFSVRRPEREQGEPIDVRLHQERTEYLLEAGWLTLIKSAVRLFGRHPWRFFQAKRLAWRTSQPGCRGMCLQVVYFFEACYLACRLKRLRIGLLHNHIGENSATVAMLASHLAEIPYSLTIHGPGIFYAPEKWALGAKLDRAAFTACISHYCHSQCQIFASASSRGRLHVVRCAVPQEFVDAPPATRLADPPLLVCVGRLCVEKGHRLLVEAALKLHQRDHRFRLALVGDGPLRPTLESLVKQWGISDLVEFHGWQSSERVRELLSQAHTFVLPSFAEGLPIVLMEAMASRLPVVTTSITAIGELVVAGENGWLVPPGDLSSLVEALVAALAASSEDRRKMGDANRVRVLTQHHPVEQAQKLLELMEAAYGSGQA
jgi:glycosyltransferase involved in cell wall biosynthesis